MKMSEILSLDDIKLIKSECARYREAGISMQAVIINGIRYNLPPAEGVLNEQ